LHTYHFGHLHFTHTRPWQIWLRALYLCAELRRCLFPGATLGRQEISSDEEEGGSAEEEEEEEEAVDDMANALEEAFMTPQDRAAKRNARAAAAGDRFTTLLREEGITPAGSSSAGGLAPLAGAKRAAPDDGQAASSVASGGDGDRQRRALVITRMYRNSHGKLRTETETVTDDRVIDAYLSQRSVKKARVARPPAAGVMGAPVNVRSGIAGSAAGKQRASTDRNTTMKCGACGEGGRGGGWLLLILTACSLIPFPSTLSSLSRPVCPSSPRHP